MHRMAVWGNMYQEPQAIRAGEISTGYGERAFPRGLGLEADRRRAQRRDG